MDRMVANYVAYLRQDQGLAENTVASYQRDLNQAVEYFATQGIDEWAAVDQYTILNLVSKLKAAGRSAATINRQLSVLRQFYRYMIRHGHLRFNPMELVDNVQPTANPLPAILTSAELQKLLTSPDPTTRLGCRDRAMLATMAATGMRVSETVDLSMADLHLDVQMIRLGAGNQQERLIPLSKPAAAKLQTYLNTVRPDLVAAGEEAVFLNAHGHRLSRQGIWKNLKHLVKQAGIAKPVTPQTLRYSFAVQLLKSGADSRMVQAMLGYSELRALKPYLKMTPQELASNYHRHQPRL